jgi:hypothetical protein
MNLFIGFTPKALADGNYNMEFIQLAINQCEHPLQASQMLQDLAEVIQKPVSESATNQVLSNRATYFNDLVHVGIMQMSFTESSGQE